MSDETKHGNTPAQGGYERQDIRAGGIIYFLAGLAAATLLIIFLLDGFYRFLDRREKAHQPPVSPLVTNVPEDTRKVAPNYPETSFPNPRLETDERTQLNDIRIAEEQRLNSYGWVDEKAGIVHIPIERAMDLMVQHGLPTHSQSVADQAQAKKEATQKEAPTKEKEKRGKKS